MNTTSETITSTPDSDGDPIAKTDADTLMMVVGPIIIILGTLGHILTTITLMSKHIGTFPSAPYLIGIAICDMMVLYSGLLHTWVYSITSVEYETYGTALCKLRPFIYITCRHVSVWLVIAVSIDRVICVLFPIESRSLRKKHRLYATAVVGVVFTAVNTHLLYGKILGVSKGDVAKPTCTLVDDFYYKNYYNQSSEMTDLFCYSFIPFVILVICNISMLYTLRVSTESIGEASTSKSTETNRKLSLLPIILGTTFIVTTMPISLLKVIASVVGEEYRTGVVYTLLLLLGYSNHAINFLLYALTGPKFRNALKAIFTK